MPITYRSLRKEEICRYDEIDRSEVIDEIYYWRCGKLVLEKEHYDMKGFPPGELEGLKERQAKLLGEGGDVIGAFEGGRLVGIASVEKKIRGKNYRYVKMDVLHVSLGYRKRGIGAQLVKLAKKRAEEFGGERLYVSATPSKNTVEFYLKCGARIAEERDEESFLLEPEDIHMEMDVYE